MASRVKSLIAILGRFLRRHGDLTLFFALNWLWLQFLSLGYWWYSFSKLAGIEVVFLVFAYASVLGVVVWLVAGVNQLILVVNQRLGKTIAVMSMVLLSLLLIADWSIYNQMKFHLNGAVWAIVTSPSGLASLNLTSEFYLGFALLCGLVICIQVGFLKLHRQMSRGFPPKFKQKLFNGYSVLSAVWFGAFLIQSIIYIYADTVKNSSIKELSLRVPLYLPVEVRSYTDGLMTAQAQPDEALQARRAEFSYNVDELNISELKKPKDIFIVVLDSWRYDMLNHDVMPNFMKFAKTAEVFRSHYSGGNQTRHGIFSLFYGIPASYWKSVLANHRSPVMMDALQHHSYDVQVFSSSNLHHPEFRETVFINIPDSQIHDRPPGGGPMERDLASVNSFIRFLKKPSERPKMAFLFLDGSHGPYSYDRNLARKFMPDEAEYFVAYNPHSEVDALRNRYKNSLYQIDMNLKLALDTLAKKSNSIVVLTSDHGEEFLEHGFRGHCSAFTDEQVKVPLIIKGLNRNPSTRAYDHMTSHSDLVYSLLEQLGIENPSQLTTGASLYEHSRKFAISCGWDQCSVISQDHVTMFGTESYNSMKFELRDGQYVLRKGPDAVSPYLREAMGQMAKF
jgi:hypothetical protein